MLLATVSFLFVSFLGYANGANDNFKGVATLYGSGATTYRGALRWATLTTFLGSVAAILFAQGLVATFSGKGLVPDSVLAMRAFPLAVVLSAASTVMLATWLGFPISTTHALTGALVGAGLLASPEGVNLSRLGAAFFLPLLLSPLFALALAGIGYYLSRRRLATADVKMENRFHFTSAGIVCFARALNDTPKIAALLLMGAWLPVPVALLAVALVMALGGWRHSARIAETMSHKVTTLSPSQGLAANLVTGALVIGASQFGLPVSTTHVACGSLFGIGTVTGNAQWKSILGILTAWVTTLPIAAALGASFFFGLRLWLV